MQCFVIYHKFSVENISEVKISVTIVHNIFVRGCQIFLKFYNENFPFYSTMQFKYDSIDIILFTMPFYCNVIDTSLTVHLMSILPYLVPDHKVKPQPDHLICIIPVSVYVHVLYTNKKQYHKCNHRY